MNMNMKTFFATNKKMFAATMVVLVALFGGYYVFIPSANAGHVIETHYVPTIKCVRGVEYYTTIHGIAPAYKPDGTLYSCEGL